MEDSEEERLAMVAAARSGERFKPPPPTVRIEEVVEEAEGKVDRVELVQAGSPFSVLGAGGDGGDPSPGGFSPTKTRWYPPSPRGVPTLAAVGWHGIGMGWRSWAPWRPAATRSSPWAAAWG